MRRNITTAALPEARTATHQEATPAVHHQEATRHQAHLQEAAAQATALHQEAVAAAEALAEAGLPAAAGAVVLVAAAEAADAEDNKYTGSMLLLNITAWNLFFTLQ